MPVIIPTIREATIRAEGDRVVVIMDGRAVMSLPWQAADQLATAIRAKARQVEEYSKADQIAFDQAILIRAGATVGGVIMGLTAHPAIVAEAGKEAGHNRRLRRYMGGIKSQSRVGKPGVKKHAPRKEQR